jgi:hypothetical protein
MGSGPWKSSEKIALAETSWFKFSGWDKAGDLIRNFFPLWASSNKDFVSKHCSITQFQPTQVHNTNYSSVTRSLLIKKCPIEREVYSGTRFNVRTRRSWVPFKYRQREYFELLQSEEEYIKVTTEDLDKSS